MTLNIINDFNIMEDPAVEHPIYQKAFNIKFNLEWLTTRVIQLKESWKDNLCQKAIQEPNNVPMTFDFLTKVADDAINLCAKCLADENVTKKLKIRINNREENIWGILSYTEKALLLIRQQFDMIVSSYNERIEGKQVTLTTSPWLKLAERAGLFDLIFLGIDNLMKSYVGLVKDEQKLTSGLHYWYRDYRTWNGISSTWLGDDYEVSPNTQILKCPVNLKLAAHDLLPPLSHEAAHVIFGNILPLVIDDENNDNVSLTVKSNIQNIHALYLSFYSELTEGNRIENISEEYEITEKTVLKILKLYNNSYRATETFPGNIINEFFIDLIGALIGGPGLFISLYNQYYEPAFDEKDFLRETHPSVYQRMLLGKYYCKYMDLKGSDWYNVINNILTKLEKLEEKSEENYLKFLEDQQEEEVWMKYWAIKHIHDKLKRAFRDDFYITNLMEIFSNCYCISPLFIGPEDNPIEVYESCRQIAEKIWYKSKIITNARVKDIVAASTLYPIRRPAYPTGRLYQSFIYSSFREEQILKKEYHKKILSISP